MASSSPANSSAVDQNNKTGFLSLSRELRDMVYDLAYQDLHHETHVERDSDSDKEFRASCACLCYDLRTPLPNLRLVDRQVRMEYDQHSPLNSRLSVYGRAPVEYADEMFEGYQDFIPGQPGKVDITIPIEINFWNNSLIGLNAISLSAGWRESWCLDVSRIDTFHLRLHLYGANRARAFQVVERDGKPAMESEIEQENRVTGNRGCIPRNRGHHVKVTEISLVWSRQEPDEPINIAAWTRASGFKQDD